MKILARGVTIFAVLLVSPVCYRVRNHGVVVAETATTARPQSGAELRALDRAITRSVSDPRWRYPPARFA